ncbi:MAG TPA: hypothetical protein P5280_03445, partial [Cyclobacteriaceae bacterium]|nr:hypothetical protein [Cyclobacteriaceae bacterium]
MFAYDEVWSANDWDNLFNRTIMAWHSYQVNENGYLVLDLDDDAQMIDEFRVIGQLTGEVVNYPHDEIFDIKSIFNPFQVSVYAPSHPTDLTNSQDIWQLIHYVDLKQPEIQEYEISVNPESLLNWGFSWCARSDELLTRAASRITFEFLVNGSKLDAQIVRYQDNTSSNGWYCNRWSTLITNWHLAEQSILEIKYTLLEAYFDGEETFPPGVYHQVIRV